MGVVCIGVNYRESDDASRVSVYKNKKGDISDFILIRLSDIELFYSEHTQKVENSR